MWFAQQLAPDVAVCIAQYVDLRGPLDIAVLQEASARAGHEFQSAYLRLAQVDGEPVQTVDHGIDQSVHYLDLRGEDDPMASALAWIDENYVKPVDMENDPLQLQSRHGDPALAAVRTELSRTLAKLRKCAGTTCR